MLAEDPLSALLDAGKRPERHGILPCHAGSDAGGAVAWIDEKVAANAAYRSSFDPDGDQASQLLYLVQDMDGDENFGGTTPVLAEA